MINGKYLICYCDDIIDQALSAVLFENFKNDECDYEEVEYIVPSKVEDPLAFFKKKEIEYADVLILDSKLFSDKSSGRRLMGELLRPFLIVENPFRQIIIITANGTQDQFGGIQKCPSDNSPSLQEQKSFYVEKIIPEINRALKIYKSLRAEINKEHLASEFGNERARVLKDAINNLPAYSSWNSEQIDSLIKEFKELEKEVKNHV